MDTLRALLRKPNAGDLLRDLHRNGALSELIPELAAMDIKSRLHKDMLEHSVRVFENAVEMTDGKADDALRVAALFHDIGKPATRKIEGSTASFRNHESVGAKIARKVLPGYGYTKAEVAEVQTLVALHMRGHSFENGWTDSAVRRLVTDVGSSEQLERLIVLFAADATTNKKAKLERFRANAEKLRIEALRVIAEDERKALRPALNGNEVMELLNLKPGRELGAIMKFLNSDEGINLTRDEAERMILTKFQ